MSLVNVGNRTLALRQIDEAAVAADDAITDFNRLLCHRIDGSFGLVRELHLFVLQPIPWHAHTTGGQRRIKRDELAVRHLLQHFALRRIKPSYSGIGVIAFGIQDHAVLASHVVVHRVGVDDALALAKDNVAFEVDLAIGLVHRTCTVEQPCRQREPADDLVCGQRDGAQVQALSTWQHGLYIANEYRDTATSRTIVSPVSARLNDSSCAEVLELRDVTSSD